MLVPISLIKPLNWTKCFCLTAWCNVVGRLNKFIALQNKTTNNAKASRFTTGTQQMKLRGLMCLHAGRCVAAISLMSTYVVQHICCGAICKSFYTDFPSACMHVHTHTNAHTLRAVQCTNSCDRVTELSSTTVPFLSAVLGNRQNWPEGDMAAWQSSSVL